MSPWDDDKSTGDELTSDEWDNHVTDQKGHSSRHENNGSDELDVTDLSGVLADAQTPQTEAVEDIVSNLLSGGTNISLSYDDANDVLTIDTSALNTEEVEDAVASLITAGNAITVNYDDANDSLSIAVDESSLSFYDGTNLTADVDNESVTTESLDVTEESFVHAELRSNKSDVPAGEWGTITDNEVEDNLGEFDDSNQVFVPSETGWYNITGAVYMYDLTDGDDVETVVRDVDSPTTVDGSMVRQTAPGTTNGFPFSCTVPLSSGTSYAVQARGVDNQYSIAAGGGEVISWTTIRRSLVAP